MLADLQDTIPQSGYLNKEVHLLATSRYELLNFIAGELPRWRDRGDRKVETAETALTSQLCAHLNSAARHSTGWDFLQFRIEEPDEQNKGRKIDLVPAPCAATVWIEGRRHTDFDTILPIECKRLPTPIGKDRDEREYVINRQASTGGIQRFKAGHHGATYGLAAMIAYVQKETTMFWSKHVAKWIKELVEAGEPGWGTGDFLRLEQNNEEQGMAVYRSLHARDNDLGEIELRHLWLQMN